MINFTVMSQMLNYYPQQEEQPWLLRLSGIASEFLKSAWVSVGVTGNYQRAQLHSNIRAHAATTEANKSQHLSREEQASEGQGGQALVLLNWTQGREQLKYSDLPVF